MSLLNLRSCAVLCSIWIVTGCASWSSIPPQSQPYFTVDPADAKALHTLVKKQEALLPKCAEHNSCDHLYFTRALLGLYENRENAEKYFEKVIALAPKSHLASSSRLWLQLLREHPAPVEQSWFTAVMTAPAISDGHAVLALASDRLVRDLLDRELIIQQLRAMKEADAQSLETLQRDLAERERKMDALSSKKDTSRMSLDMNLVQSFQKQLTDRDKKIEELTSQLEALKRIDQEMREKVRPVRPPSAAVPTPEPLTP